jgi:hyaluronoglucosaminidase
MTNSFFGYIEGYYGAMLSWEQRGLIVETMRKLSLNCYLYAPKEDPYHRLLWRTAYSRQWMTAFYSFVKKGNASAVSVIPGIAPGLSFDYCSKADYRLLLKKCFALADTGVRALCLLMDDIPVRLPRSCKKAFASLGSAHGELLGKLQSDLKKAFPAVNLLFCPTVYADQLIKDEPAASKYLVDLAGAMPGSICIFWTGSHVISKEINRSSLRQVISLFRGNVCIWDNLYANDYCPRRLFIGSYRNRNADILQTTRGILVNPTGLVHTDSFILSLLSGFVKKIGPEKAWKSTVENLSVSGEVKTVAPFFDLPYAGIPPKALSVRNLTRVKRALKKLIWEWKSPLQREWYPYLYSLDNDIALLEGTMPGQREEWIRKKYPPVLAKILIDT